MGKTKNKNNKQDSGLKTQDTIHRDGESPEEHAKHADNMQFVEKEVKKVDVWRLKPYSCKVKVLDIFTGKKIIVLNKKESEDHDIYSGYRTEVKFDSRSEVAIVDVSDELVKEGEAGVFSDLADEFKLKNGDKIEILHMNRPQSIEHIKKKLDGATLMGDEIYDIVKEIMDGKLSEVETSAWVTAAYIRGFSDSEIIALTHATVKSGEQLNLGKKPVADKHSAGGVAGNRTTMVVVPIIASAGIYIPKTSSRAISSASGTADTVETIADVTFSIEEMREIVLKSYGAMVWGGGMKLAPIDDKLIRIRNPLSLDPEGMLLASILGKKKAVGADYLVADIPVGRGAKIFDIARGQALADHFIKIGKSINIRIEALITDGAEPIGNGIGPALECMDVLDVLSGKGPEDLRHKSCMMSGKLLELLGRVKKGTGYDVAMQAIQNGKALAKFREIIELQGGSKNVKTSDIALGEYTYEVKSDASGQIFHIDNKVISKVARLAGAPRDKGAGIYLHRIRGDRVEKWDKIFTIYAESEQKLSFAIKALENLEPIEMRRMLLGSMRG